MSVMPDPTAAPPYYVDLEADPHFDPHSVPFSHHDSDGTVYSWSGMWDPSQRTSENPRRVVPDPKTRVTRLPMAGISTTRSSGSAGGTFHWTSSSTSDPWMPDMTDLSDAQKLRALADWFDRDDDNDDSEVQDDLRQIARRLEDSVEPNVRVEQSIETIMDWLGQHDEDVLAEDGLDEAMEVLTGWLSER